MLIGCCKRAAKAEAELLGFGALAVPVLGRGWLCMEALGNLHVHPPAKSCLHAAVTCIHTSSSALCSKLLPFAARSDLS